MYKYTVAPESIIHTFVASDTHFDHSNIIKYCERPFKHAEEMNAAMVHAWNSTVQHNDTVFFLGDVCFGRGSRSAEYWLNQLNGHIMLVMGNHDRYDSSQPTTDYVMLHVGDKAVMLTHSPWEVPGYWKGWVIHGHTHNRDPFIDASRKHINVSMDVTNFEPVRLDAILRAMDRRT